ETSSDPLVTDLTELTLQTMGVIGNHCGTALGTLVQARRQICRNNLRRLQLVAGQIFGPAAQEALDWRVSMSGCLWCLFSQCWCKIPLQIFSTFPSLELSDYSTTTPDVVGLNRMDIKLTSDPQ
ncbi:hypothetical protein M9458_052118, partial [Cirrhinus mrigala]